MECRFDDGNFLIKFIYCYSDISVFFSFSTVQSNLMKNKLIVYEYEKPGKLIQKAFNFSNSYKFNENLKNNLSFWRHILKFIIQQNVS